MVTNTHYNKILKNQRQKERDRNSVAVQMSGIHEALNSSPSTAPTKKKKKRQGKNLKAAKEMPCYIQQHPS
jgi:hypothetical protein